MHPVTHHGCGDPARGFQPAQPHPEVPVFGVVQPTVERALPGPVEHAPVYKHGRASTGNRVALWKQSDDLRGRQWKPATNDLPGLVDVYCTRVVPPWRGIHRVQLTAELVRCPEVVIVTERQPLATRRSNAPVPCTTDAVWHVVTQHTDPIVRQAVDNPPNLTRRRAVVHDDDFQIDVTLPGDRAEGLAKQVRPVMCWYHDANGGHTTTLASINL